MEESQTNQSQDGQKQKMMLVIAGVVVLLLIGGFFLLGRSEDTPAPAPDVVETFDQDEPFVFDEEEMEVNEIFVEGSDFSFSPGSITVEAGERVRVVYSNVGANPHDFRIDELGVATRVIQPGQTDMVEFTAAASGTYTFYCSVDNHRQLGMEGSLDVE